MGFHGDVKREKTFIALIYGEIERKSLNVEVKRLQQEKSLKHKAAYEKTNNFERNFHAARLFTHKI